jgi:hypothetical protein
MTKSTFPSIIGTAWNRKVSVAISMPQSLIEKIDTARGDIPRSVFVCRILRAQIKSEKEEAEENEQGR